MWSICFTDCYYALNQLKIIYKLNYKILFYLEFSLYLCEGFKLYSTDACELVKLRISDILLVFAIEISIIHNIRSRKLTCNKNHHSVIYNCRDRPFPSSVWWSLLKYEH